MRLRIDLSPGERYRRFMLVRAVIFDLDGTLLDTLDDITAALNVALHNNGFATVTSEQCRERVGWGLHELVRLSRPEDAGTNDHSAIRPERDNSLVHRLAEQVGDAYRRNPVEYTKPYPGIETLLTLIGDATIKTAVLSNKPDELVQVIVARTLGDHRFDVIRGGRPGTPAKPDPTSTREILDELGVNPGACMFIGDSDIDMETARNAGCMPVAVSWGFRDVALLQQAGARHVCYSTDNIRALLGLEKQREEL